MFTHQITRAWQRGNEEIRKVFSVQGGAESNLDETIAVGSNQLVAFTLDVSQCKELFLLSDTDLIVKTNSSGSPANTFTLTGGVPFTWVSVDPALRDHAGTAVTTDITALYVTNASGGSALFQMRSISDPTV